MEPLFAEFTQGLRFENAFGEREHDPFLLVEMLARRGDGIEQDFFASLNVFAFCTFSSAASMCSCSS